MYISIRECHLPGLFGSIKAGLDYLGLDCFELEYLHDKTVIGVDTEGGAKVSLATDADVEAYAQKCKDLGVKVSAILLHNNFGAEDLDAELDWVISAAKAAHKLGAKAMRIDAKMIQGTLEERTDHFAMCMNKILDATKDTGVEMGIENHGKLGNEKEFIDLVLNKVGAPRLGATIDTANFYWYGYPVCEVRALIEYLAPRTKHTHVKNINYPADKRDIQREMGWEYGKYASSLREGDIDMKWLVTTLAKAGYRGDLCIEDESLGRYDKEQQKAILKDDADLLKEILGRL
jgi:sugar phosphate isomerase/epimerase